MKKFSFVTSYMFAVFWILTTGLDGAEHYNVTIGSTFEIGILDLPEGSDITQFEKKPDIYITGGSIGSKKKKAKGAYKNFSHNQRDHMRMDFKGRARNI